MYEHEVKVVLNEWNYNMLMVASAKNATIKTEEMRDEYYEMPGKPDTRCRIRYIADEKLGVETVVTLHTKGKVVSETIKSQEEIIVNLDDMWNAQAMNNILLKFGLVRIGSIRKCRKSIKHRDMTICFDRVYFNETKEQNLAESTRYFVEVEIEAEKYDKTNDEKIMAQLRCMGVNEDDIVNKSYIDLLLEQNL